MPMDDLATLFRGIRHQPDGEGESGAYAGAAIPGMLHHIARDRRGRPVLLLSARATDVRPASIHLENLRVEHGVRCNIVQQSERQVDDRFTILQCQSEDAILQRCFVDLCQTILAELAETPTQRQVADRIDRMASLFRALDQPSQRSVQGLWGELLLISRARDALAMARAWHNDACECYDFADGAQRLEVKTSGDRLRIHHLTHRQANPPPDVQCVIASMFVEASTGGLSLGQLWDSVRDSVAAVPSLRARIDEISFAALGGSWREARQLGFDEQLAATSLAFYDVQDIPRIDNNVPEGVLDIRFRSDLSRATTLTAQGRPTAPPVDLLF